MVLVAVVVLLYGRALGHGLVSDDFLLFAQVADGLPAAFAYHGSYHWYPLGLSVLWLQHVLGGVDGGIHHALTLALFAALGLATVRLGRRLGLASAPAWGGGFLLVTSLLPFEVPLWAIGSLYSVSALLAITAFLAYLRLVETPGWPRQAVFVGLYAAAFLTHEQAVGLPLAAALWSLLVARERRLGALVARLTPALGTLGIFIGAKLALSDGTALLPGLEKGPMGVLGPAVFHGFRLLVPFLPADFAWAVLRPSGALWALPVLMIGVFAALAMKLDARERFLVLWGLGQVGLMAVAIGLASRHYALPLVPVSLALASLLARAAGGRKWLFVAAIAALGLLGAVQLQAKVAAWSAASRAVERILDDVERAARERPAARQLFVIDLPDGLRQGESEPAYIFRLGFEAAARDRLPGRFLGFERRHTEPRKPWVEPFGRPITPSERATLAANPDALVLVCPGPEDGVRIDRPGG